MNITDIKFYLSGGSANTNPDLSLGGILSSSQIKSQQATTAITGVTITDGIDNPAGDGTLDFVLSGTTLAWASAGDTAGAAVDVSVDGIYRLDSGTNGFILVDVTSANLPAVDTTDAVVSVTNIANNIFDDINAVESSTGDTEYRCVYIKNSHGADTALTTRVWIASDASGADSIEIGLGVAAVNVTEQVVADESTAPTGVAFSAPTDYAGGLAVGDLSAGDYKAIWIKRTVPSSVTTSTLNDTFKLGYGADIS